MSTTTQTKPAPKPRDPNPQFRFRASRQWIAWLNSTAAGERTSISALIDRALVEYAGARQLAPPPPRFEGGQDRAEDAAGEVRGQC